MAGGGVQRIHKTNRESIHGSIHEPNHEDRHESNHERIDHTNHERIHETIHETIHQQHTKGFTTGFTKGFTTKTVILPKMPSQLTKKQMENHLVQNLCCIVGLPHFGAESLLYWRRQTFILPKMASRLGKSINKCKIIWCRISVVSSVSQILVQNLWCIGVAQLLYYLKWPSREEIIINSNFITRISVVSTGFNFITRISVVSPGPPSS